jgi:hypothetical protein
MQIDYSGVVDMWGHILSGISVLYYEVAVLLVLIGQGITIASRPCQTPLVAIDPEDLFADMV